jgi:hypothetical protein
MVSSGDSWKFFFMGELCIGTMNHDCLFGLRWQSAAATALSEPGGARILGSLSQSGVALRLPPHSKTCGSLDGSGEGELRIICLQIREAGA